VHMRWLVIIHEDVEAQAMRTQHNDHAAQ
jgi:hypothetical protein